jgi:hypothetical protein
MYCTPLALVMEFQLHTILAAALTLHITLIKLRVAFKKFEHQLTPTYQIYGIFGRAILTRISTYGLN